MKQFSQEMNWVKDVYCDVDILNLGMGQIYHGRR